MEIFYVSKYCMYVYIRMWRFIRFYFILYSNWRVSQKYSLNDYINLTGKKATTLVNAMHHNVFIYSCIIITVTFKRWYRLLKRWTRCKQRHRRKLDLPLSPWRTKWSCKWIWLMQSPRWDIRILCFVFCITRVFPVF